MDSIDFAEKLGKELKKKEDQVAETYMSGALKDIEHHKYLQGQL